MSQFFQELLTIPNLFSLSRIFLAIPIFWLLSAGGEKESLIALGLCAIAGITDGLDGYLARKLGKISRVGIALDPIADKIFAGFIVIALLLYREFPLWLAAVIIGRDLVIVTAGALLLRGRKINLPSNITGKYAFSAIATLLVSFILGYPFGIWLSTVTTLFFATLSIISYAKVFYLVRRGYELPAFHDRLAYKLGRRAFVALFVLLYFTQLYIWYTYKY